MKIAARRAARRVAWLTVLVLIAVAAAVLSRDRARACVRLWLQPGVVLGDGSLTFKTVCQPSTVRYVLTELAPRVGTIQEVWLREAEEDATFEALRSMPDLEALWTCNTSLTDRGMPVIGQLRNLRLLVLSGSCVTDKGVRHLRALDRLERLDLSETVVSDRAVEELARLPSLRVLEVMWTNVTEAGVARAAELNPKLRVAFLKPSEEARKKAYDGRPPLPCHERRRREAQRAEEKGLQ